MPSTDFFSFELYTKLTIGSASLFSVMFIFVSYFVLFKTPDTLKTYKFHFIYLHTTYLMTIFLVGFFGRIDVHFNAYGAACASLFGIIQLFDRTAAYIDIFLVIFGVLNVGNTINLTFVYRYCHICRPNSFYATHPFWQRVVHILVSLVTSTILTAVLLMAIVQYAENNETVDEVMVCFRPNGMFNGSVIAIASYLFVFTGTSCFLIYRVIRTLQTSLIQASAKTREMQKALTITLLVFAAIPLALGGIPVMVAVYAFLTETEQIEIYFRFIFFTCIWQGPLTISATLLLVKPYRQALLSSAYWRKIKEPNTLFKITRSI
uniref:G_PROTEIN_RECEP_F1_2 domain-containing protein n=1 Tax=Steinernema glaseri TaxID=37863 RepID=A0A1I7ZDD5_9BILA